MLIEHQLARLGSCLTPWSSVAALPEGSRPASPVNDLYRSALPASTHTDPRHLAFLFAWSGAWKGQAVFKLTSRRNLARIPDSQKPHRKVLRCQSLHSESQRDGRWYLLALRGPFCASPGDATATQQ